jgi:hypothetical protein
MSSAKSNILLVSSGAIKIVTFTVAMLYVEGKVLAGLAVALTAVLLLLSVYFSWQKIKEEELRARLSVVEGEADRTARTHVLTRDAGRAHQLNSTPTCAQVIELELETIKTLRNTAGSIGGPCHAPIPLTQRHFPSFLPITPTPTPRPHRPRRESQPRAQSRDQGKRHSRATGRRGRRRTRALWGPGVEEWNVSSTNRAYCMYTI